MIDGHHKKIFNRDKDSFMETTDHDILTAELLHQPSLQTAPVLLLFTKTDLDSARSISEFKSLMRLEDIKQHSGQEISVLEFNTQDKEKLGPVLDWCLKYKTVPFAHMNGSSY